MRITSLSIYPIKGCRGVALDRADVDRLGLAGDRRLVLVNADDRFITQRDVAALATIVPTLADDVLAVTAPGLESLRLHLAPDGEIRPIWLWWDDPIFATDQGDTASDWFSEALGGRYRLMHFGRQASNPIDPAWSPREGAQTAFTDGYPLLVVLQESLDDLNSRLEAPVPMDRFRPSVVVAGADAWSEDGWREMQIGELRCDSVKPCARCVVPTTDQQTGRRHPTQEPLRTLASFRTVPKLGAIFGQNVVPRDTGALQVGGSVTLS
jgi:uncharacterized protein